LSISKFRINVFQLDTLLNLNNILLIKRKVSIIIQQFLNNNNNLL